MLFLSMYQECLCLWTPRAEALLDPSGLIEVEARQPRTSVMVPAPELGRGESTSLAIITAVS